jgi:hypothetical protein
MTNYQKTKIYKIESHLGNKIYIGSTCKEYLSQRFQCHLSDYKRYKKGTRSLISSFILFNEYGPENCKIVLIESYPCNNIDEKNAREGYFIKELECVNIKKMGHTKKEYYEDNKESFSIKNKEKYEKNKEKIKERVNKYNISNNEIILIKKKEYRNNNKDKIIEQRKKYKENNIEKIKADKKSYYEKNKDILNEKNKLRRLNKKLNKQIEIIL